MTFDLNTLWPYKLRMGSSDSPRNGACTMDAVSWFSTGKLGDHPECACPLLTAYVIRGQDAMPDDERQLLKPFIFRLIGSRDPYAEPARLRYLVLGAGRILAPMALDAIGLRGHAQYLRTLPDGVSFAALLTAARAARAAATHAADAAAFVQPPRAAAATVQSARAAAASAADAAAFVQPPRAAAATVQSARAALAAHAASATAAHTARAVTNNPVWRAYIEVLDGALNLGKQGEFDFELVPDRLREFAEAR